MSDQLLHQQWTTLSQHFAELEIAVKCQQGLKRQEVLMTLVSKIRASLDAGLIVQLQQQSTLETAAELENKVEQPTTELRQMVTKLRQEVCDRTRAEQKLRASLAGAREREKMYQQILDSIADMVLVKAPKSKIFWANKAFRDYYGMTNEQLQDIVDAPFNEPDYTLQYIKDDAYVFETGEILAIPAEPVTRHDGEVRLFSTVKSPIRNNKGEVIMTVGVSRDITFHKQAEAALAESEAKFRRFVEDASDIIHSLAPDGKFTYISPNVTEILGYEMEEMIGKSFVPFIHPQDREACIDFVKGMIKTGQKQAGFEFRAQRKDGSWCWMTANNSAIKDADGNIVGLQGIVRDISDRKQVETALIESERKYRILVETSQDMIWATDKQGRYTFVNSAARQIYGYSPEEMIGRPFVDFIAPEEWQKDLETYQRVLAGESFLQYETTHMAKNGNSIHLAFNAMVLRDEAGNVIGATGTASDITKRKTAEIERDRFFNISLDMMCICDMDGYFKQANPAFETALGYTMAEILAAPFINFVHPDDIEKTLKQFDKIIAGAMVVNFENRWRCKDGAYKWLSWKAAPYLQDGLIYAIARDVSDRKAAIAALAESEMKFRHLVENANDLIYEHSIDGIFTYLSPKVKDITGFDAEELLGRSFIPLVHSEDLPATQAFLDRIVATGDKQAGLELRAKRKDGSWYWMTCNISPLKDAGGNIIGFQGIARDISERKIAEAALQNSEQQLKQKARDLQQTLQELQRTQSQLLQSEKMSSLGQIVAGVAHEINNPVSFIYGNLTHAKDYITDLFSLIGLYQKYYPNPVPQIQKQAEAIELNFLMEDLPKLFYSMKVGAERIEKIVASLRNFSRIDESELKAVDIHEGLDSTLMLLQHRLKAQPHRPGIEIIKEYGNLPLFECYARQLNQVFMNILSNAIDALEQGNRSWHSQADPGNEGHGKENTNYQLPTIRISTKLKDNWAIIRIADNGPGMAESVKQKLFDPFFTTKPVGKGTGMGLSISYQIITSRHKGSLQCISSPGKGAEFEIKIPLKAC
ncbi:PAS domain-containing sensor histidine kinase [Microseira wollei]|uniref:histidine kinase n=1 Tax=Microseira wollei NIES-4236 TaxID=2530354 RepID=A0AAV3XEB2_9CYAN|nr:PAS domain S-box protein [Microseira wollei]GET39816.1 PAS/PAC sensor signal transduction histidine kinase [Microseira wollei NIES-4236]